MKNENLKLVLQIHCLKLTKKEFFGSLKENNSDKRFKISEDESFTF